MGVSDVPIISGEFYLPPSEITPILWIGNYLNGAELVLANPRDFRAVLNVSTEQAYKKAPGIAYLEVPFDDGHSISVKAFTACMEFLMFQYETGKKTLVHCAAGVSRSAAIAAAFMHVSEQMTFDVALNRIKQRRPIAQPHPDITTSIRKLLKIWPYNGDLGEPYKR
jgi:atypical dual specificity phosphatase